ncbi:hypothetical protein [Mucilaginibacter paludis]|uniref:Uncharacterized protein n=1 Tax=Mucilaginibacter paludis DSM 18603 TaxID=714943 RepID=H1YD86_9SPHI|nr:hypothetical protein [Mucilaginibacter paludis]EHQ27112.1 hypothetical protein Mucpa_3005 [Mucilaginibacter paludis DSM 18603]
MNSKADFVIRYLIGAGKKFLNHPSYVIPKNEGPFTSDKPAANRSRAEDSSSYLIGMTFLINNAQPYYPKRYQARPPGRANRINATANYTHHNQPLDVY